MKLMGYLRVSTEGQVEEGFGLDVQRAALRDWSKANGHRLVAVVADEGISGTKGLEERPGLSEALLMIQDGKAEGLLVYSLHRLARRLDVQEAVLTQVWKLGGRAFAVDTGELQQDDAEDPMRTFIRQVLGAVSQLEKGMISARLRAGRRVKDEQGGYAYGAPPFGWRAPQTPEERAKRKLVPVPEEQGVIKRIRKLSQSPSPADSARTMSLREIADALEVEGLRPRKAARWSPVVLSRIVGRLEGKAA